MKNWTHLRTLLFLCTVLPMLLAPQAGLAQGPITDEPGPAAPVNPVEVQPAAPVAIARAFSGGAAYDSGWISLAPGEGRTLYHNLKINNPDVLESYYVVDMQYRNIEDGVNQRYYGGIDFGASPPSGHAENDRVGAYWRSLAANTIVVYRRPEDTYAEQVRIQIWIDSCPSPECWDSSWQNLSPDVARSLTHNMGAAVGDEQNFVVDMQFKNSTSGINQRYYGGADFGASVEVGSPEDRVGVYWRTLTYNTIVVYRRPEDTYAEQARIRIWKRPKPTFDSDWVTINKGQSFPIIHGLGGQTDDYLVTMEFKTTDANGINHRAYGGMDTGINPSTGLAPNHRAGAYWHHLTSSSITVYRLPEDIYVSQVRIRIFRFWSPTPPDYDSGWQAVAQNASLVLTHNLGGNTNDYMVDLIFRGGSNDGINQRYYGGADYGSHPDAGHLADERAGVFWNLLNTTSITVYRRPEDTFAQQVRVRIWRMPLADYNSGWVTQVKDSAIVYPHHLGGSPEDDYLVYLEQYNSTDKVNQRFYGGLDFGSKSFGAPYNNYRLGSFWHQLTGASITLTRQADDVVADLFRVRIWRVRRPDYGSGWVTMTHADPYEDLAHNVGGLPEFYFLQMTQWDTNSTNTLNQRHYGGNDFGNAPPSIPGEPYYENDRVGACWFNLNAQSITVFRRQEDGFAEYVMVRIWTYAKKLYLPAILK